MTKPTVLTDRFDRALLYATHVHGGQILGNRRAQGLAVQRCVVEHRVRQQLLRSLSSPFRPQRACCRNKYSRLG